MKKSLGYIIILFLFIFIGMESVKAANLIINPSSVNASTSSKDYTFVVTFSGANGWNLSYDSSYVYPSGTNPINNGKLNSDSGSITFAVKKGLSLSENKSVSITIKNENSEESLSKNININSNVTKSEPVTPAPTTAAQAKSNNANLKTLIIKDSNGDDVIIAPNFSANVYEYSADVPGDVKTVTVEATLEDSKANMIISNNVADELVAGENNKIVITVTAEDGTKKAYNINIKREALTADATLKSLKIKEYSLFKLKQDKYSYKVKVKSNVKKLTLDYETNDENSIVKVTGNKDLKNGSKVKILVTAEDGTKKEYVLNIIKDSTSTTKKSSISAERNPLIIMALSMVAFGLIGGITYVIKK